MKEGKSIMRVRLSIYDIITIVAVILSVTCVVMLNSNDYYGVMGRYREPTCIVDLHKFESDSCPECGKSIKEVGVLYRLGESYDYAIEDKDFRLDFSNMFDSYEEYVSIRKEIVIWTALLISFVLVGVVSFIIKRVRRSKK